ncbi:alpha/beta fold hydrolase [Corynebacterium qintianiae]|uniref:alpha/beta fold hydrolase n=1 Tax=Corynebacterium qintianiae TaxID=2709392 RepID=UPI0013EDF7CB|nr:alpha/beta fold hydrolase [Corynebacterium qintianiae]
MKSLFRLSTAGLAALLMLNAAAPQATSQSSQQIADGLNYAATTPVENLLGGYDPFYDDPVADLGAPGTLLRTQAAPHLLNVIGPGYPGYAEKILYTSTTIHGEPVATSGFVIEPATPWRGSGPTPTIVFAPGTRGSGDACAPSRGPWLTTKIDVDNTAVGVNYELPFYETAAHVGIRVVVVDYIGLGTPGPHTYVLHDEEAHAMLDAARAVVPAGDPVAFYGYSQGGGAAAAAAEQQPAYAPELNLKGTFAGAPPADLLATLEGVDNSMIAAVLGYAVNGWIDRYPEVRPLLESKMNERGAQFIAGTANSCMVDGAAKWAFTDTRTLTDTGESVAEILAARPEVAELFEAQKLGQKAPTTPIMVSTGGADDLVPTPQATQLARDYCAAGVNTTMFNEHVPALTPGIKVGVNHAAGIFTQFGVSGSWIIDRFNDVPATSNCGSF